MCSIEKAVLKKFALFSGKHLQENTFHLRCFDFMSNTVCIICIILIITLSVKIKIKICLLGQLKVALQKIQNEKKFSSLVYRVRSYRTFHEIRNCHRKRY